jgi:hypothetical protein
MEVSGQLHAPTTLSRKKANGTQCVGKRKISSTYCEGNSYSFIVQHVYEAKHTN